MPEAVIVDAVRTPIGRAFKGSLAQLRPDDMGAFVRRPAARAQSRRRARADRGGRTAACGLPQGLQAFNIGRIIALLSEKLPIGVNGVDGLALLRVQPGDDPPGGQRRPGRPGRRLHRRRRGVGEPLQRAPARPPASPDQNEKLQGKNGQPDAYIAMGLTAENVADKYEVSRADMDKYAQRSQELAVASQESGFFDREIVPVTLPDGTTGRQGRRPARQLDAGEALAAAARLPGGRQGHGGQLVPAQRRRGGGARDVGRQGRRSWGCSRARGSSPRRPRRSSRS